ncbi:MAG: zonular occludens toxin domain-containing protein [Pseudomonadota bacterium]
MIVIVTGAPGCGKTSYVVNLLDTEADYKNRTVFCNVTDLTLPHEPLPNPHEWPQWAPDGALIIIDECQDFFRPRATGSKVPDYIAAFEKHRHKGLDFILITQHPNLIDANIRRLVGKHIHVRRHAFGGQLLEWTECNDPDSKASRSTAAKRNYKPPKNAFGKYKSATIHTKHSFRLPKAAFVFVAAAILLPLIVYKVYSGVNARIHPEQQAQTGGEVPVSVKHASASVPSAPASIPHDMESELDRWKPVVPGRPETAPAYDELRKVSAMPWPHACIQSATRCSCYSQQGTRLHDIEEARCRQLVEQGGLFNPYEVPNDEGRGGRPAPSTSAHSGDAVRSPPVSSGLSPDHSLQTGV